MTDTAVHGITDLLTNFCVSLRYADLPDRVRAHARDGVMDTLGVALCGAVQPEVSVLLKASVEGASTGATVIGTDVRAHARVAAMLGGYCAHVLDYDDSQHKVGTHMSAPVLPAAIALAERFQRSGAELLTAYVAGFEVGCRLGRAGDFAKYLGRRGVHSTGYLGHLAAAAAGGNLLELDAEQMHNNFGIAAGHASGTTKAFGTMCKAQNAGNAAGNGVLSTLLARSGFTGPRQIFDGELNVFGMFDFVTDHEVIADGLGADFEISHNTLKVYACAGWRNPIIESVLLLSRKYGLAAEDIDRIRVVACRYASQLPNYSDPRTGLQAKFSAEHAAAVALIDQAGGVAQFTDERAGDPQIVDLRRRTTLEFDDTLGDYQIRVHMITTAGREYSHFVANQKGDYRNPLTAGEKAEKFCANASAVLPLSNVNTLIDMLNDLEAVDNVAELTRLCRPGQVV